MNVLVDTSVWVDFLNGHRSSEAAALKSLLDQGNVVTCGLVVAEIFQGLRRDQSLAPLESRLRLLHVLEPRGLDTYLVAAGLFRALRAKGITIRSTIDCLIAVLAAQHRCFILARDRDMKAILNSGLVGLRAWPPQPPA